MSQQSNNSRSNNSHTNERASQNALTNKSDQQLWVVIPAAGLGSRFGATTPKQYADLAGRMVLQHSLDCFIHRQDIAGVVLVIAADDQWAAQLQWDDACVPVYTVTGGEERSASVAMGLRKAYQLSVASDTHISEQNSAENEHDELTWVLVHDAARPLLTQSDVQRLIDACLSQGEAGILAQASTDTLKRAHLQKTTEPLAIEPLPIESLPIESLPIESLPTGPLQTETLQIEATLDRTSVWRAQTPQMAPLPLLMQALSHCGDNQQPVTDEASALEFTGHAVHLVESQHANFKITHADDLAMAECVLAQRQSP